MQNVRTRDCGPSQHCAVLFDPLQASCSVPASAPDAAAGAVSSVRAGDCRPPQRRPVLLVGLHVQGVASHAEGTATGRSAGGGSKRMTSACIACGKPDLLALAGEKEWPATARSAGSNACGHRRLQAVRPVPVDEAGSDRGWLSRGGCSPHVADRRTKQKTPQVRGLRAGGNLCPAKTFRTQHTT
jgi:hypothetical protein